MIDLTSFLVDFSPKQKDMVGIPVMPYIIDPREDHGVMPTSWDLKQAMRNLLKDASAPHIKSSWESLKKTLDSKDWRKHTTSRYQLPPLAAEPQDIQGTSTLGDLVEPRSDERSFVGADGDRIEQRACQGEDWSS